MLIHTTQVKVNYRVSGFTLLELLISIVIFSLVAAMAYSGLNNVLLARVQTEAKSEQLYKLQMALTLMERDIEQAVDRTVRNEYGDVESAFVANEYAEYDGYLLQLTRTGWLNPLNLPRSHLQRIAYSVKEEKLIRTLWFVLDRAQDSKPYDVVLLEDVKNLEIRYLDEKKEWQRSWPPATTSSFTAPPQNPNQPPQQSPQQPPSPKGIVVELETKNFGKVERWFRLPG